MPKLYAFIPKGFGPLSYFVMADSEADARAAVSAKAERIDEFAVNDWGGPNSDYEMMVCDAGHVVTNPND